MSYIITYQKKQVAVQQQDQQQQPQPSLYAKILRTPQANKVSDDATSTASSSNNSEQQPKVQYIDMAKVNRRRQRRGRNGNSNKPQTVVKYVAKKVQEPQQQEQPQQLRVDMAKMRQPKFLPVYTKKSEVKPEKTWDSLMDQNIQGIQSEVEKISTDLTQLKAVLKKMEAKI
jgi:hypothetical protein